MSRVLEFEVSLEGLEPRIWRRFLLRAEGSFEDLHEAIQDAFGWDSSHLWEFQSADEEATAIAGVSFEADWGSDAPPANGVGLTGFFNAPQRRCLYLYDFGDGWRHEVVLRGERPAGGTTRSLLAGERACPPEDSGGPGNYPYCVDVAGGLREDPEDEEFAQWLSGWTPDGFELSKARQAFDVGASAAPSTPSDPIADLFASPPEDQEALELQLGRMNTASAREGLIDLLERGGVPRQLNALYQAAFALLGLGPQRGRLADIVRGDEANEDARLLGLSVFMELAPEEAGELTSALPEALQRRALQDSLGQVTRAVLYEPEAAQFVVQMLQQVPADRRGDWLAALEGSRQHAGVPAGTLYAAALESAALRTLQPMLLDALVREGGPATEARLQALAAGDGADVFGEALAAVRRGQGVTHRPEISLRARLSGCDGQGSFNLFVAVTPPSGEGYLALVCGRAGVGIREGQLIPDGVLETIEGMFVEQTGLSFASVPAGVAAALVAESLSETLDSGAAVPDDAWTAVEASLFASASPLPEVAPGALPDAATVDEMLRRDGLGSWFLDRADLTDAGVDLTVTDSDGWAASALAALDRPALRARLAGMCGHMARWHQLQGADARAGEYAALAQAASRSLADSPLAAAMLALGRPSWGRLGAEGEEDAEAAALAETVLAVLEQLEEAFVSPAAQPDAARREAVALAVAKASLDAAVSGSTPQEAQRGLIAALGVGGAYSPSDVAAIAPALGQLMQLVLSGA